MLQPCFIGGLAPTITVRSRPPICSLSLRITAVVSLSLSPSLPVLTFFSGAFTSKAQHERSPDDTLCEKADDYALKLEQELTNLEGQLEMLMRREKNVARTWVELGMACGVVSQMEAAVNERVNVSVFQVLGSMSDQVAVMVARKGGDGAAGVYGCGEGPHHAWRRRCRR